MSKQRKSPKKSQGQLIQEYNDLMSRGTFKVTFSHEWVDRGDQIQKFSIYENYTPVKISSGTGTIY